MRRARIGKRVDVATGAEKGGVNGRNGPTVVGNGCTNQTTKYGRSRDPPLGGEEVFCEKRGTSMKAGGEVARPFSCRHSPPLRRRCVWSCLNVPRDHRPFRLHRLPTVARPRTDCRTIYLLRLDRPSIPPAAHGTFTPLEERIVRRAMQGHSG